MVNLRKSLFSLGVVTSLLMAAAPLSPTEALQRASTEGPLRAVGHLNAVPAYTVSLHDNTPAIYVFVPENGKGYRIIAGNDVAFPVLGYSDDASFDPDAIPAELKWWLGEYARQIEWAEQKNFASANAPVTNPDWHVVEPLIKTKWDQDAPYNDQCPTPKDSEQHCYTGCVATSMAQVMNYFKYPEVGQGTISYKPSKLGRLLILNLGKQAFDWNNMLDNYAYGDYSQAQADAVAYLMKACGYSVQMNYGIDASGAAGSSIGNSLRTYFKYDEGCRSEQRDFYSMSDWTRMIYDNLSNIGPVIINGRDFDGSAGHSFICDGYDGKGYFHFNWGWSGMSDGYYSLDALNPDAMGVGGYGGGFNNGQNAIFGIQPPTGEPYTPADNILIYGNLSAQISNGKITLGATDYSPTGWGNPTDRNISGTLGISFHNMSGNSTDVVVEAMMRGSSTFSLSRDSYYAYPESSITANMPSLSADGLYSATLVFKGENTDWQPAVTIWGYHNYVLINKQGSSYNVSIPPVEKIKVNDASIASELYYNKNTLFKVTYSNNSDVELSQGVVPRLYRNGQMCMEGSGVLVTVGAGVTEEQNFISRFQTVNNYTFTGDTEFDFCLYDPTNKVLYGNFGKVTMTKGPSMTSIVQTKFEIEGAEQIDYKYGTITRKAYNLADTDEFKVDLDYLVRYGYFDGRVRLGIYEVDPNSLTNMFPIVDEIYSATPFLNSGQTESIQLNVNFPEAENGVLYAIRANYTEGSSWKSFATIYFVTGLSGVDNIMVDSGEEVEYHSLLGMPVKNPKKGEILIRKSGGKTEKIIY